MKHMNMEDNKEERSGVGGKSKIEKYQKGY